MTRKFAERIAQRPVLVIALTSRDDAAGVMAEARATHPGARLVLLVGETAAPDLMQAADEVWPEGVARGPARFLALMRRMSWMGFSDIYDAEGTQMTRLMRYLVWPRPRWHP
ncbi:MAG: hypothetical protein Q7T44_14525 [Parvibaculum sp.]|nr:hypothetical protein [Parvibaculum sp.]